MPVDWDSISPIYPLSEEGNKKALICDSCDSCSDYGKCMASECKCFIVMLVDKKDFSCPLDKWG